MSLDLIKKVKPKLNEISAKFCFDTWSHTVEKPIKPLNQWQGVMFGARGGGIKRVLELRGVDLTYRRSRNYLPFPVDLPPPLTPNPKNQIVRCKSSAKEVSFDEW